MLRLIYNIIVRFVLELQGDICFFSFNNVYEEQYRYTYRVREREGDRQTDIDTEILTDRHRQIYGQTGIKNKETEGDRDFSGLNSPIFSCAGI